MDMHNVVYGHATNLTFGSWDSVFASNRVLTAARLDRVLHHSIIIIIIIINGERYRLKDKRKAGLLSAPGKAPRH
jgi:DNA replication protein DnaC